MAALGSGVVLEDGLSGFRRSRFRSAGSVPERFRARVSEICSGACVPEQWVRVPEQVLESGFWSSSGHVPEFWSGSRSVGSRSARRCGAVWSAGSGAWRQTVNSSKTHGPHPREGRQKEARRPGAVPVPEQGFGASSEVGAAGSGRSLKPHFAFFLLVLLSSCFLKG